jgi:hypothetical protein
VSFGPSVSDAFQAFKSNIVASPDSIAVKWPGSPLSTHFEKLRSQIWPVFGLAIRPSSVRASSARAIGHFIAVRSKLPIISYRALTKNISFRIRLAEQPCLG